MDLSGWVGVGLGGTCDGILYAPMFGGGVVYAGLDSLTSSPCSSGLLDLGGGLVCLPGFAMCACA